MRYRKYTIQQGDTLQLIAQTNMSSLSQWVELAKYNNLKHPYIVGDPMIALDNPNVVCYGDTIIIPIEVTLDALSVLPITLDSKIKISDIVLGKDFSFIGDLTYAENRGTQDEILELTQSSRGTVSYVKGVDNLRQAILHRLWTKKGTLPLHPEYGSNMHTFIGKRATEELITQVSLEIMNVCNVDPRIDTVELLSQSYSSKTKTMSISLNIKPIGFDEVVTFLVGMDNVGSITLINE